MGVNYPRRQQVRALELLCKRRTAAEEMEFASIERELKVLRYGPREGIGVEIERSVLTAIDTFIALDPRIEVRTHGWKP